MTDTQFDRLVGNIAGAIFFSLFIFVPIVCYGETEDFGFSQWFLYGISQLMFGIIGWGVGGIFGEDINDD